MIIHAYKSHTYTPESQSPQKLEIQGLCGNVTPFHALPGEDVLAVMDHGQFVCFSRIPKRVTCKSCLKCSKLPLMALDNVDL